MTTLSFFIGVYKDQDSAKLRIGELKQFYPDATILSISDGIQNDDYAAFCASNGVKYQQGDRLKTLDNGGAWIARRLKYFIDNTTADVTIRIDPDIRVQKTTTFPDAPAFGFIYPVVKRFYGPCLGISRSVVTQILNGGFLSRIEYKQGKFSYPWFGGGKAQMLASEEFILADILKQLNVTVTPFQDIGFVSKNKDTSQFSFVCTDPDFPHT